MSLAWYWVVLVVVWALVSFSTWRLCRRILRRLDGIHRVLLLRQSAETLQPPAEQKRPKA